MDRDARTADEIQRDIERERADLSNTLNSLSDTLSFENMTDTLTQQMRGMGADVIDDLAGTLVERARQKPVAAGLVFAGLAWMALGGSEKSVRPTVQQDFGHQPMMSNSRNPSPSFESTRPAANERIEQLANDARILRDRVAEGTEALSKDARDRVVKAREAAVEAAERAVDAMKTGAVKTKDVVQDNPLAVGGIALAIGAAVGGVVLLKKKDAEERAARNEIFREADRVMKAEMENTLSPRTQATKA